jgi:hypothetical protein
MSAIRPDKKAGPTFLNEKASKDTSDGFASAFFLFFLCASAWLGKQSIRVTKIVKIGFISLSSVFNQNTKITLSNE